MRRAVPQLAPRLVVLLLALAAVPTLAGDVERAQELIESVSFDDPRFTELHDLARKPAVRKWLRARVRELWKDEMDRDRAEPYFQVLARTGAGREEVQFLVDAGARSATDSYSYYSVIQGGRPRALPSIQLANWDVSLDPDAKVLATPEGEAHALHPSRAKSLTWTNLASMAETPAGEIPDVNHFAQASIGLGPRGEVYLALPLQEQGGESPRYWIGSARIGERFTARGILEGSFSRNRQTSLAMTAKGEVYLVASLRPPGKDDGQVALWHLSGAFPPQPILTPWLDSSIAAPQAVFIEERKAVVAWGRGQAIHVETFALPDG